MFWEWNFLYILQLFRTLFWFSIAHVKTDATWVGTIVRIIITCFNLLMTIAGREDDDIAFLRFYHLTLLTAKLQCGMSFLDRKHFMGVAVVVVERVDGTEPFPGPVIGVEDGGNVISILKHTLIDQQGKSGWLGILPSSSTFIGMISISSARFIFIPPYSDYYTFTASD